MKNNTMKNKKTILQDNIEVKLKKEINKLKKIYVSIYGKEKTLYQAFSEIMKRYKVNTINKIGYKNNILFSKIIEEYMYINNISNINLYNDYSYFLKELKNIYLYSFKIVNNNNKIKKILNLQEENFILNMNDIKKNFKTSIEKVYNEGKLKLYNNNIEEILSYYKTFINYLFIYSTIKSLLIENFTPLIMKEYLLENDLTIIDSRRANNEEDQKGIDFILKVKNNKNKTIKNLNFQIKSSSFNTQLYFSSITKYNIYYNNNVKYQIGKYKKIDEIFFIYYSIKKTKINFNVEFYKCENKSTIKILKKEITK